jgi:predicted Zn finger-like uncharacterized protein
MEITCNRCKTEYDFDDALVSERGTTVRCTNCGEQFKVYRSDRSAFPERWVVQRRDGRELVFTNLRDLQRAITNLQVGRHDTLTRGSSPPRALAAIAELEPFFLGRLGSGGPPGAPSADPMAEARSEPAPIPRRDLPPARSGRTGRPPAGGPAAPAPAQAMPPFRPLSNMAGGEVNAVARTVIDPPSEDSPTLGRYDAPGQYGAHEDPLGPSHARTRIGPSYDPPPTDSYNPEPSYNPEQDWFGEPHFSTVPPTRSRALRWLVVLVLLGMLGVAGATVGRKYVAMVVRPTPAPTGTEGRVDTLLDEGNRALADSDLETAKESFDKASALAERDARVLIDLARLDAARADTDWLKVRLLPSNQPDVIAAAKRQADQSATRALKIANQAAEVAPDDPKMARAKIDTLRLSGDLASARSFVARVGAIAAQPETAYVLAALDLAEESPNWPAVIDRLKTAAAGESNPGRARGALVYALARSGDLHLAKEELEKMAAAPRPYALLAEERAFLARMPSRAASEVDAGKREAAGAASVEVRREGEAPRPEGEPAAGNYRTLLQQASQAQASGNYERAEQLYRAALTKSPGDTEALGGLGDVARARGNPSLARTYYERVLASNPHYLPALASLADLKWDSGDKAGAAKLYRDIMDTTSEGPLAERAKARVAQVDAAPKAAPRAPARPAAQPPSPAQPPSDTPPDIDTSDLPGFKR